MASRKDNLREASDSVASLPSQKGTIPLSERSLYALCNKARESIKEAPNFLKRRKTEVQLPRILLPRTSMNKLVPGDSQCN
jgi:hypothetical protein